MMSPSERAESALFSGFNFKISVNSIPSKLNEKYV